MRILGSTLRNHPAPPPALTPILVILFAAVTAAEAREIEVRPLPDPPRSTTVIEIEDIIPAMRSVFQYRAEDFILTAYCAGSCCCGKWAHYRGGGWTASGTRVRANHTIAVDPRVIPLGTVVCIEGLGRFTAEDTGSAIKGRRIDIYMTTHTDAMRFGIQKRKVVVVQWDS